MTEVGAVSFAGPLGWEGGRHRVWESSVLYMHTSPSRNSCLWFSTGYSPHTLGVMVVALEQAALQRSKLDKTSRFGCGGWNPCLDIPARATSLNVPATAGAAREKCMR